MTSVFKEPNLPTTHEVEMLWHQAMSEGTPTFEIIDSPGAVGGKAITCAVCGLTSHNPEDVKQGYCGYCHRYHEGFGR